MHISKDYKTTLEFSKKLARATRVKKGWRVLDLFLGLGYSAGEILNAGAAEVVCFEVRGGGKHRHILLVDHFLFTFVEIS